MPNTTVAAAAPGLPSNVLPFQSGRTVPPNDYAAVPSLYEREEWLRAFVTFHVAGQYRDLDASDALSNELRDLGAGSVADQLRHNAAAISFLRGALATFLEADRRYACAADQALSAIGFPSGEVRT